MPGHERLDPHTRKIYLWISSNPDIYRHSLYVIRLGPDELKEYLESEFRQSKPDSVSEEDMRMANIRELWMVLLDEYSGFDE